MVTGTFDLCSHEAFLLAGRGCGGRGGGRDPDMTADGAVNSGQ